MNKYSLKLYTTMQRFIFAILMLLLCSQNGFAIGPKDFIEQVTEQVLQAVSMQNKIEQNNQVAVIGIIENLLLPHFDIKTMSRRVMGKYWKKASNEQRQTFFTEFKSFVVRSYAAVFANYNGQRVIYLPVRNKAKTRKTAKARKTIVVGMQIAQKNGKSIKISYRLKPNKEQWLVLDMAIQGVSQVSSLRSQYSGQIQKEGLDVVIQRMRVKNQQAAQERVEES